MKQYSEKKKKKKKVFIIVKVIVDYAVQLLLMFCNFSVKNIFLTYESFSSCEVLTSIDYWMENMAILLLFFWAMLGKIDKVSLE